MYVATLPLADFGGDDRDVVMYNTPGRVVGTHPTGGVVFMFRRAAVAGFSSRNLPLHKQLVTAEFTGNAGVFAEAVVRVRKAGDLYCDAVSRVRLPQWSQGPVTLVGDAASCVPLFGDGSSHAMVGAHTLAEELTATPGDLAAAVQRYEQRHRRLIDRSSEASEWRRRFWSRPRLRVSLCGTPRCGCFQADDLPGRPCADGDDPGQVGTRGRGVCGCGDGPAASVGYVITK